METRSLINPRLKCEANEYKFYDTNNSQPQTGPIH